MVKLVDRCRQDAATPVEGVVVSARVRFAGRRYTLYCSLTISRQIDLRLRQGVSRRSNPICITNAEVTVERRTTRTTDDEAEAGHSVVPGDRRLPQSRGIDRLLTNWSIISARCNVSAACVVMWCPSVRVSVTFVDHVITNKHIIKIFKRLTLR